jgi:hypothetical protein
MYQQVTIKLTGLAPLMLHNPQLADPMSPVTQEIAKLTGKRAKTLEDRIKIQELEWMGGLYLNTDGAVIVPGHLIEGVLRQAGGLNKVKKKVEAGVVCEDDCILEYNGPKSVDKLKADANFRDVRNAKIMGKMVMRCRPIFRSWSLVATLSYLPSVINKDQVFDLMKFAGIQCGLGDYRPKHGRFIAEAA